MRRHCQVCQATTHRNWLPEGKFSPHPVPPRKFSSVRTDIFAHAKVKDHRGEWKDKIFLISCQHTGFIVGWPTREEGLTAEAVAPEYADRILANFDVPIKITSDNGPKYAATIWKTLHHLAGTRCAYGQAYWPQSNGKAESAGKALDDIISKVSLESKLPWVEVLPRAIASHNDLPGEIGLSPHQLLFGRERLGRGPGLPTEHESEDMVAFMD